MVKLMEALKSTRVVRLTGSRAMGTNRPDSDIDLYITPDRPDTPHGKRNIERVKEVLGKFGLFWESTIPGYIFTHKSDNGWLELDLDISDIFRLKKGRMQEVEIYGVTFRTR